MSAARAFFERLKRHRNAAVFLAGFLFDVLTIKRADSWADIALQLAYIAGLTGLLVLQYRHHRGEWKPGPRAERWWAYNVEALHFLYGGLLSAYVVLYSMSSAGTRALAFFLLLVALLLLNEMPQVRRIGYRLRLGLYAFCVASFMIYFVPVLVGRMGTITFLAAIVLSGGIVWGVAGLLAGRGPERRRDRARLFLPAGTLLALVTAMYALKVIPPVPLSVRYDGIYHSVEKTPEGYRLRAPKPGWTAFWRSDSRPFRARPGDEIHYFVRVFAPSRFRHKVMIRWEHYDEAAGRYLTSDRMPLDVSGGRQEGYRGFAVKANYRPGRWRVRAETEDGRTIGLLPFRVTADEGTSERRWIERLM